MTDGTPLTIRQAARARGCSRQRIYALIHAGRLVGYRNEAGMLVVDSAELAALERGVGGRPRKALTPCAPRSINEGE